MISHFLFLTITACFDPKTTQQPSSPRCFQRNHISPFWSFHTSYSLKKLLTSIQTQQWNTKRFTPLSSWRYKKLLHHPGERVHPTLLIFSHFLFLTWRQKMLRFDCYTQNYFPLLIFAQKTSHPDITNTLSALPPSYGSQNFRNWGVGGMSRQALKFWFCSHKNSFCFYHQLQNFEDI